MRTSTSFAILTLLATAGQTFGVPIKPRDSPATINAATPQGKGEMANINSNHVGQVGVGLSSIIEYH